MKIIEYAPYLLGFLVLLSVFMLFGGMAFAGGNGSALATVASLAKAAYETQPVHASTQNDAIGTRDYSIDAKEISPSFTAGN
ncbi:MAG: hypothetical protein LJE68_06570 [Rhodobacter sp.]|nr:hypothetical protein [Rhodobacter sp.]